MSVKQSYKNPCTPWIGPNYERTGLLILGESTFRKDDDQPYRTMESQISEISNTAWKDFARNDYRFLASLTAAMSVGDATDAGEINPKAVWENVAITNYVPGWLESRDASHRPKPADYEHAVSVFPALLDYFKPRLIAVLGLPISEYGRRSWWEQLMTAHAEVENHPNFPAVEVKIYKSSEGQECVAVPVGHPTMQGMKFNRTRLRQTYLMATIGRG